jgi:hypothetical protein
MIAHKIPWLCMCVILLAGCSMPAVLTPSPIPALPSATPTVARTLTISLLYPKADTEAEMGQSAKFIVRVTDAKGQTVPDAQVTLTLHDASGQKVATIPATAGDGQVYRTEAVLSAPQRPWRIDIEARQLARWVVRAARVKNSTVKSC